MITKHLAIAAAFVLMTGLSSAPASAQDTTPTAPAATAPAAAFPRRATGLLRLRLVFSRGLFALDRTRGLA